MAAKKRTKVQIEADRKETAAMYLQGQTQAVIGVRLSCSQQQISYDLKVIRKAWLASSLVDFHEARARELAKVDLVELTHWDCFQLSREKDGIGDKRFLDGVESCIDKRCKLLALYGADKIKIGWEKSLPEGFEANEVKAQFAAMLAVARRQAEDD